MWKKEAIVKFWKEYQGNFFGDVMAPEIFRLSKKYIRKKVLGIGAGFGVLIDLTPNAIRSILLLNVYCLNQWLTIYLKNE